jgi:uncharacterized cupin superfamily protein
VSMGRGEVETLMSTDGHLTNWHYDFQENFTIQLSGIKRWSLQQGTIKDPIRGCTPHYAAPESVESQLKAAHLDDPTFRFGLPQTNVTAKGDIVSIDVKPGDVFYFPAGMWHKVETIEPGVSINVSLMASNYAAVTCQALQHYLLKDKRWREPVLNNKENRAVDHLKMLLKELPSMIQDLERNGGAEAVLPPILTFPPRLQSVGQEGDWENVSDNDNSTHSMPDDAGEEESGPVVQAGELEEDNDIVVDPADFDRYPGEWSLDLKAGAKIKIVKNPLAALHTSEEITSFYEDTEEGDIDKAYVLNVNYAGNEMHNSVVRVVFRDTDEGFVQMLYKKEREIGEFAIDTVVSESNSAHLKFLTFHGYLQILNGERG